MLVGGRRREQRDREEASRVRFRTRRWRSHSATARRSNEADDAPTVIAFLPGWAGYAWAFPRLDHISFGIATAQDAFDHKALDRMLWDFMAGYYRAREGDESPSSGMWTRDGGGQEVE